MADQSKKTTPNSIEYSNRRPSDLEVRILRASLDQDLTDLSRAFRTQSIRKDTLNSAEREVAELTARLEAALSAKNLAASDLASTDSAIAVLETSVATKRIILHPIRTIPTEILVEIFRNALARPSEESVDTSAIVLSSVSRQWKEVMDGHASF